MAFLNEVGKVIGKASQGISDAKQTISDAAQETRENIARERQIKEQEKEAKKVAEQEKIAGEARKCPKCGQEIPGLSATCPLCGYEIRNAKTTNAIRDLTNEIDKLEKRRNTVVDALSTKISGRTENPTDEKIASLIRNFVVPNTKEDIFEFMILAAGNMDAKFLAGVSFVSEVADVVIKAWESKFHQTYDKAKISFGNDPDFSKVQELYDKKMAEIESYKPKAAPKKTFPWF